MLIYPGRAPSRYTCGIPRYDYCLRLSRTDLFNTLAHSCVELDSDIYLLPLLSSFLGLPCPITITMPMKLSQIFSKIIRCFYRKLKVLPAHLFTLVRC